MVTNTEENELEMKKFHQMDLAERLEVLKRVGHLGAEELSAYSSKGGLQVELAVHMIENVVGLYSLPVGIAQNFVVNGRPVLVPMVIEEPSVVAGASFMAKLAQPGGGFAASVSSSEMIGQMQLLDLPDIHAARELIEAHQAELLSEVDRLAPSRHGGGARGLEVRMVDKSAIGPFLVVHLVYDVQDVMGANAVNSAVEALASLLERLTGGRVHLKILSNLADRRLARAEATFSPATLAFGEFSGEQVRDGVIEAWAFAEADPYRAATHNKGIMNGIDAVVLATGNDWRGVEAGAHAWAACSGRYTSLSTWRRDEQGNLHGTLELPLAVGIYGGATRAHPTASANLHLMGVKTAGELAEVMVSVGLAQNLAALRALSTEGIQRGHMALHARQVAIAAGAEPSQVEALARQLVADEKIKLDHARQILDGWNG